MPGPILPPIPLGPEFSVAPLGESLKAPSTDKTTGFGEALGNAIEKLADMQRTSGELAQAFATGQSTDIAGIALQAEQAHLALQVAAQIRNRAVDAYHEIFRMQI
jgi:flagellar hook-basal body complex protein FliE